MVVWRSFAASLEHSVRIWKEEVGLHSLGGSFCFEILLPESAQEFIVGCS
jgi:hypothetical protein